MPDHTLRTGEDVDAILKIALNHEVTSGDELRHRLQQSASELGISPEALAKAEEIYLTEKKVDQFMAAKKAGLQAHMVSFVSTNVLLHVIWYLTSRDFYWPGIVLASWGVFLASHWFFVKQRPNINDKHFQRWLALGEPTSYVSQENADKPSVTVGVHIAAKDGKRVD